MVSFATTKTTLLPTRGGEHRNTSPQNTPNNQSAPPQQGARTHSGHTGNPEAERRKRNIEIALKKEYNAVGINLSLSIQSVKKAYRIAALQHHPDKGGDPEIFKLLGNAVEKITKTLRTFLGGFGNG